MVTYCIHGHILYTWSHTVYMVTLRMRGRLCIHDAYRPVTSPHGYRHPSSLSSQSQWHTATVTVSCMYGPSIDGRGGIVHWRCESAYCLLASACSRHLNSTSIYRLRHLRLIATPTCNCDFYIWLRYYIWLRHLHHCDTLHLIATLHLNRTPPSFCDTYIR